LIRFSALNIAGGLVVAAAGTHAQGINDAQIAAIVVTANQVDVDAGRLARERATNSQVKKFAEQMVSDHEGVNTQAVALATKLKRLLGARNPKLAAIQHGRASG
jgi:putative membrane protein